MANTAVILELIKSAFLGIVEGFTEWLPISSTGHLLLVDEFVKLNESTEFKEMYFYVIQLGAILAVLVTFWNKMWPFCLPKKGHMTVFREDVWAIWFKVVVSCIPGFVVMMFFDDFVDEHLSTPIVISLMLIIYGVAFILVEQWNKRRQSRTMDVSEVTYKQAFIIGLFQALAIIPGTSRSGATIIGALIIGIPRTTAAEFTFFIAFPVMVGLSFIKILKFGFAFTAFQLGVLGVGLVVAFLVSLVVVKFLMNYLKRHSFRLFGIYRIVLGAILLVYFLFIR